MDRILEKKPFIIRYRNYLIAGVVFLAFLIYDPDVESKYP